MSENSVYFYFSVKILAMPTPEEIWAAYDAPFRQTINQAQSPDEIERYYYKFVSFLSEQNHTIADIERLSPIIRATMKEIITEKFIPRSINTDLNQVIPNLVGDSNDIIVIKTNIRAYNRIANWMNAENQKSNSRPYKKRYKDDLWLQVVKTGDN